jgi:hypothetical protein
MAKYRYGFVSNSSSSSFVVSRPATRVATTTTVTERLDEIDRQKVQVDTTFAPYMRQRSIIVDMNGMKPFTKLYAFLDNTEITAQLTPCTNIRVSNIVGDFQKVVDSGIITNNIEERTTDIGNYDILNRGDVITTPTGSAVLISKYRQRNKTTDVIETVLKVANIKGTLSVGQTVTSKVKGGTALIDEVYTETDIVPNSIGSWCGIWSVPPTTFETKLSVFTVNDLTLINRSNSTSFASTDYRATGTIKIFQDLVTLQRNAEVTVTNTNEFGNIAVVSSYSW